MSGAHLPPHSNAAPITPHRIVRVVSNEEIAPRVFVLRFRRPFAFTAGQVVAVAVGEHAPVRYYSIASGELDQEVEILYDLVADGALTPRLALVSPGDDIFISDPFGTFHDEPETSWWIATGTGIAPFLSMARSGNVAEKTLVHGGRTLDRFYYRRYLASILQSRYVCCCSTEAAPGVYAGRLTNWLREQTELSGSFRYLLCGGAGMVVEVRDILISKGVPYGQIAAEIYF